MGRTEELDRPFVSNPYISSSVSFRMGFSWVKQSWHNTPFFPPHAICISDSTSTKMSQKLTSGLKMLLLICKAKSERSEFLNCELISGLQLWVPKEVRV